MINDLLDALNTWEFWLGTGIIGVIAFFAFLLIFAGPKETKKIAEIPIELAEIEANLTRDYVEDTKGPIREIISDFWKTGGDLANDVSDPALKQVIRFGWLLVGILIAGMILFIPLIAIKNAFDGILGR